MESSLSDFFKVGNNGVIVPDTSSIREAIISDFKDMIFIENNGVIDTTSESAVGRLIDWLTVNFSGLIEMAASAVNQFNINYATGNALDAIGDWFDMQRISSSYAEITCTISGVARSIIPSGFSIKIGDDIYTLQGAATIDDNGFCIGIFVATEKKPIGDVENQEIKITSVNPNVESIQLVGVISGGSLEESDYDFRERIITSASKGSGFLRNIYNAIRATNGVKSAIILENYLGSDKTEMSVVMQPHTIYVCVEGGDDKDIAEAIYKSKSAGCGYTTIVDEDEYKVVTSIQSTPLTSTDVVFYRPVIKSNSAIEITVKNVNSSMSNTELQNTIKKLTVDYINSTLNIGDSISAITLAGYLQSSIKDVLITNSVFDGNLNSITATGRQLIRTSSDKITVVVN